MATTKTKVPTSFKEPKEAVKPLPDFQKKIRESIIPAVPPELDEIKKRHRRTRAEIEAEEGLSETPQDATGYEILVDLLKAQADLDTKKYNLPVTDKGMLDRKSVV